MKPSNPNPETPEVVALSHFRAKLTDAKNKFSLESFWGLVMTSQGVLCLFFSPRFNQDHAMIVTGSEVSQVLHIIFEILPLPVEITGEVVAHYREAATRIGF